MEQNKQPDSRKRQKKQASSGQNPQYTNQQSVDLTHIHTNQGSNRRVPLSDLLTPPSNRRVSLAELLTCNFMYLYKTTSYRFILL